MPFVASIVNYINDAMRSNCSLLSGGTFYGISSVIARKNAKAPLELLPGILIDHTQYKTIEPNDEYALIIYHKMLGDSFARERKDSYGDGWVWKSITNMEMIVWGDGKKLGIDQELSSVVLYSIPFGISAEVKKTLALRSCTIAPKSTTLDRLSVFRQEYPQTPFFLKPNHQFFSIKYQIETTYDNECIDMCSTSVVLTFASSSTFTVGMKLVQRFQVGKPGAPMNKDSTEYSNPLLAGKKVFVMASSEGLTVDDGTGAIDFTNSNVRHIEKTDASNKIKFIGGVTDEEYVEIYTLN